MKQKIVVQQFNTYFIIHFFFLIFAYIFVLPLQRA